MPKLLYQEFGFINYFYQGKHELIRSVNRMGKGRVKYVSRI